jgi:hypothetical protein
MFKRSKSIATEKENGCQGLGIRIGASSNGPEVSSRDDGECSKTRLQ